jgi:chromosome partitioning protein
MNPEKRARVVAVANQKGGVAKTTTTINLAACLGALERRVLVVDCDPQGNATRGLGLRAQPPHLYQVMTDQASIENALVETEFPGLTVLPSDRELVGLEVELVDVAGWEHRLRERLELVRSRFDFIFLDCPPSLGHLTVNALTAADQVLVPMQAEYFALEGLSELQATIRRVQSRLNTSLQIGGILLTMFDDRVNLSQDVATEVKRFFSDKIFKTTIPRNVRLAEAPSYGKPILHYDIKSRGAEAYLAVAREFLQRNP